MKKFLSHLSSIKKNLWCWTIWFQRLSKKDCYTLFCTWITSFALKIFKINVLLFNQLVSSKRAEGKFVPNMDFFSTFLRVQSTEVATPSVMDVIQGGNLFWRSQSIPASHISSLVFERNAISFWLDLILFSVTPNYSLGLALTSKPKRTILSSQFGIFQFSTVILYYFINPFFNENPVLRLVASTQEVKLEMLEDEDAMIRWD